MTPETAVLAALQSALLADPAVAALVGGQVFDEVPADDLRGDPPWIYVGPINAAREPAPDWSTAWKLRVRVYAESVDFGRREAWAIIDAAAAAIEGTTFDLAEPFEAVDETRTVQRGDVLDAQARCKTAFLDFTTAVQRLD